MLKAPHVQLLAERLRGCLPAVSRFPLSAGRRAMTLIELVSSEAVSDAAA